MIAAPIELEMRKLGLKEREVRVYLAGLELGPTSVQKIAQKTGLTRPTIYEIVRKLKENGLFAESKQKAKRFFVAQPPERILGILRVQKREIEEKEREFIRVIAALETKYSKDNEGVKTFKGKAGLQSLLETLTFVSNPQILVINKQELPFSNKEITGVYSQIKKRLGKIEVKEFKNNFNGALIIFDKVVIFPANKKEAFLIS
jgi:sugar-specific transcriptional regulator TrmB